jgi:hypothetical protein
MARMIRRFNFDSEDITLDALVSTNDREIVYEILRGIFYGIASGHENVDLFVIKTVCGDQTFSISRKQWRKALEKCMESMIEEEDYETCSEIQKALNIIKNI